MASYPNSVKSFTTKVAGDTVQPAHVNDLQDEVAALETQLLTGSTWTATLVSSGGGAPTYTRRTGYYIKLGNVVFAQLYLTLATLGTLAAGTLTITGLPATSANLTDYYPPVMVPYWASMTASFVSMGGYVAPNTSTITLIRATAATTGTNAMQQADLSATSELMLSVLYRVA